MVRRHIACVRLGRRRLSLPAVLLWIGLSTYGGPLIRAHAQVPQRSIPSESYHAAFRDLYDGEYDDALKRFQGEIRGSIKTVDARWIDAICYETMAGECYYRMGRNNQALDHYTAAVRLFVAYSDWMLRVQFSPAIRVSGRVVQIPWGASTRRSRQGDYHAPTRIAMGRLNHAEQIKHGGVVQQAHFRLVEVHEIVRCTALAIRRRAKLLGPVRRHDPLFEQLIAALSRRPGPPNHWSEAWIDLQLGVALAAGGKEGQAVPHLQRAVLAAGEFDHPLTSTAQFELGRLALDRGDYPVASKYFEEATYTAVFYPDVGVLEEAFRYGALTHLLANRKGVYPPLATAATWANVKDLRQLHTSLLLSAAEQYAAMRQTREAAGLLEDARLSIGRRYMAGGRVGARLNFLTATVLFQQKKIPEGDAALTAAMTYMRGGSHWLFHIGLADDLYGSGGASPRVAMDLYSEVLRDPQPADWALDPMEAMAVLLTPHPVPIDHWFEVALQRKEHEKALEIADRARRHRFFSSLPYGGRLQSLRWILEGRQDGMDQQSQLLRQDLLARYPNYGALSQEVREIRERLAAIPLVPDDPEVNRAQGRELAELASVSNQQEAVLREMALRREPATLIFPPLRPTLEIQKSLSEGQALLVFYATGRHLYGFLMNGERYTYWQVGSPATLSKRVAALLREMGQFQQNHELTLEEVADDAWKQSARQLLDEILEGSRADFAQHFEELVIVPDGVLWYLPFEALQVDVDGRLRPLISRFRIRYAPTASLATSSGPGRSPMGTTAVVTGRLYPRDDESVSRSAFERLAKVVPGAVALKLPLPAPSSVYGSLFDRLIVLDDLGPPPHGGDGSGPYDWALVPLDRGKAGSSLRDWLRLPWGGPDEILLPGFHTAAEAQLAGVDQSAPGNEMLLTVCGLMAGGTRTVLLSRWRTGGQTSFDLIREFAQELPHTTPSDAWQRAVFLTAGSQLNPAAEPRIKRTVAGDVPRANHPFFWAGYLLIDPGTQPHGPDVAPDAALLDFQKPVRP